MKNDLVCQWNIGHRIWGALWVKKGNNHQKLPQISRIYDQGNKSISKLGLNTHKRYFQFFNAISKKRI